MNPETFRMDKERPMCRVRPAHGLGKELCK